MLAPPHSMMQPVRVRGDKKFQMLDGRMKVFSVFSKVAAFPFANSVGYMTNHNDRH